MPRKLPDFDKHMANRYQMFHNRLPVSCHWHSVFVPPWHQGLNFGVRCRQRGGGSFLVFVVWCKLLTSRLLLNWSTEVEITGYHTANRTYETLRHYVWEVVGNPPWSPHLAPSDPHVFRPLKEHLVVKRFGIDGDVKQAVISWLHYTWRRFTPSQSKNLAATWNVFICFNVSSDCVEIWHLPSAASVPCKI
jgi:hypothetical protein